MDRGPAEEKVDSGYETPPTCILLDLLLKSRHRPSAPFDEVWPNIVISDAHTATDLPLLKALRVTHVVNAAHGPTHIDTGSAFYSDSHIQYHGVQAPDSRDFNLSVFFHTTADFIHTALTQDCKVMVHCARGVSRSATLVLAYLMIFERLTVAEAIEAVRGNRNILPNVGFLEQLRDLDVRLTLQRKDIKTSS